MPLLLVAIAVVGSTGPPPPVTANVTSVPATGLPLASLTRTAGSIATAVPTVADWASPALSAIVVAAPAVPVAVKVTGLPVSVPEVAVRVLAPAVVPRVQLVTVAMPLELVAIAVVGSTVPPPPVTANVTSVPATGLPLASLTRTAGSIATAVPPVADWASPALSAIVVAAPAVPVAVKVTGLPVSVPEVAVRVLAPAVVPRVQLVT